MEILIFGVLADVVGKHSMKVKPIKDIDQLKNNLINDFPALSEYRFQFSVNRKLVNGNILLNDKDEIAMLPPFAGG